MLCVLTAHCPRRSGSGCSVSSGNHSWSRLLLLLLLLHLVHIANRILVPSTEVPVVVPVTGQVTVTGLHIRHMSTQPRRSTTRVQRLPRVLWRNSRLSLTFAVTLTRLTLTLVVALTRLSLNFTVTLTRLSLNVTVALSRLSLTFAVTLTRLTLTLTWSRVTLTGLGMILLRAVSLSNLLRFEHTASILIHGRNGTTVK